MEEASGKMQNVGLWVRDQKWELVQFRAQEVLGNCKAILSRWADFLVGDSKNNLRTVCTLLASIAEQAQVSSSRVLAEEERRQVFTAQLRAGELINSTLGHARRVEERG